MWQITWMLSLLPDWFWSLVLIIGVLGIIAAWILQKIPFISNNALAIKVISVLMLLVGVYFQGVIANEEKYKSEHERLKAEIEKAKQESQTSNDKLSTALKERDAAIAKKPETIIRNVDRWLKSDPVVVTNEIVKEKNLSEEERKKLEDQIKELQRADKECPVPSLIIQGINEAAKPPNKGDKK